MTTEQDEWAYHVARLHMMAGELDSAAMPTKAEVAVYSGHVAALNRDAITALLTRLQAAETALQAAERWFRDYERQHRAKGTLEGNLKADTNLERADYLRAALSPNPSGGRDE